MRKPRVPTLTRLRLLTSLNMGSEYGYPRNQRGGAVKEPGKNFSEDFRKVLMVTVLLCLLAKKKKEMQF